MIVAKPDMLLDGIHKLFQHRIDNIKSATGSGTPTRSSIRACHTRHHCLEPPSHPIYKACLSSTAHYYPLDRFGLSPMRPTIGVS